MQIIYLTLGLLIGLVLLGAVGLGAYWAVAWTVGLFAGLDPQVAAVTGIVSVLALLAAVIAAGGAERAVRQARAGQLYAERLSAYALFLDLWERLIRVRPDPEDRSADGPVEAPRSLDLRLSLYGSPALLRAHRALRDLHAAGRLDCSEAQTVLASALGEIRKELGTDSKGLTPADLTRSLFPDWEGPAPSTDSGAERTHESALSPGQAEPS